MCVKLQPSAASRGSLMRWRYSNIGRLQRNPVFDWDVLGIALLIVAYRARIGPNGLS